MLSLLFFEKIKYFISLTNITMGRLKRKKLVNALDRMLQKNETKAEQQRRINAHKDNLERAKKNQIKAKNAAAAETTTVLVLS